jgi:hypothetical protein
VTHRQRRLLRLQMGQTLRKARQRQRATPLRKARHQQRVKLLQLKVKHLPREQQKPLLQRPERRR